MNGAPSNGVKVRSPVIVTGAAAVHSVTDDVVVQLSRAGAAWNDSVNGAVTSAKRLSSSCAPIGSLTSNVPEKSTDAPGATVGTVENWTNASSSSSELPMLKPFPNS